MSAFRALSSIEDDLQAVLTSTHGLLDDMAFCNYNHTRMSFSLQLFFLPRYKLILIDYMMTYSVVFAFSTATV